MWRVWVVTVLLMASRPLGVHAQERVALGNFHGPRATKVRAAVARALTKSRRFEVASTRHAARDEALLARVEGLVRKRGRRFEVTLRVYAGAEGEQIGEESMRARRSMRVEKLTRWLLRTLTERAEAPQPVPGAVIESKPETSAHDTSTPPSDVAVAPSEPADTPSWEMGVTTPVAPPPVEVDEPREPEEPSEPAASHPSAESAELELRPSVRVLFRSYAYEDAANGLASQRVGPAVGVRLEARWYPATRLRSGFVTNLGLELHAQWNAQESLAWGSSRFPTHGRAFGAAARLRMPIATHELGVLAGYGFDALSIERSQYGERPRAPSVGYDFLRLAADARIQASAEISLEARAAYVRIVGYGGLQQAQWFPHASNGDGIDAELSASYALSTWLALSAGLGFTRYSIPLNPRPTDPGLPVHLRVAKTLIDLSSHGLVGTVMRF